MSNASQIARIKGNVTAALTEIGLGGVTVPAGSNSDSLATLIRALATNNVVTFRTGNGAPSNSLGEDGDLYFDLG